MSAPLVEPVKHDDVTLRPDERLRLGSIVANWDAEVPCNYGPVSRPTCDAAAMWETRCPGCGYAWMHCDPHRRALDEFDMKAGDGDQVACATCGTGQPTPAQWRRL